VRIAPLHIALSAGIVALAALAILLMGHPAICACGYVKLWHGVTFSAENSQHLSDWYSPSHVIHGFLFYGLGWLLLRRFSVGVRLVAATIVEAAWEVAENTPLVIDRYREATIALDYFGDSVVNSASDIAFMALGFVLAMRLPVWVTVALALALELFTGLMVRDNLTLNVIMLLWPLDAIRAWQGGAG
jgi:hypothetical protein